MDLGIVMSFLAASVLLSIMPGPDNIYVISQSMLGGKQTGVFIALGLSCGVLVHTIASATGVSLLIKNSELAYSFIQYVLWSCLFVLPCL